MTESRTSPDPYGVVWPDHAMYKAERERLLACVQSIWKRMQTVSEEEVFAALEAPEESDRDA